MATTPPSSSFRPARIARSALLVLAACVALSPLAHASSVVSAPAAASSGAAPSVVDAAPVRASASKRSPAACAETFHAAFAAIKSGPFAALKAAGGAQAGEPDARLPGQLLFAPPATGRSADNAQALRSAAALARLQGRDTVNPDANARWIAARIREDLSDFLSQGPSPFLCSGIANYLDTLKTQAARIGASPDRRLRDLEAQRTATRADIEALEAALKPAPLPRFAPEDRPNAELVADTLRRSVGMKEAEIYGPPMLLAGRHDTQISEGDVDPDLPPLRPRPFLALATQDDILAAVNALVAKAEASGQMHSAVAATDAMTTGSTPAQPGARPVIERLAGLKPRVVGPANEVADPRVRLALVAALSDLEALDYLRVAADRPADPMLAALDATFEAISRAHAEACGCGD